jgi:hypothetical protein
MGQMDNDRRRALSNWPSLRLGDLAALASSQAQARLDGLPVCNDRRVEPPHCA